MVDSQCFDYLASPRHDGTASLHPPARADYEFQEFALGADAWTTGIVDSTFYLALQFVDFSEEVSVCKQALSILSKQPEAIDSPNAKYLMVNKGEIIFDHVSFKYLNDKTNI